MQCTLCVIGYNMINLFNLGIKTEVYIVMKDELKPKRMKEKRKRKNILP